MKNVILLIALVFSVLSGFSQYGEGTPETIESWKNKTLIVVQYPNADIYNKAVKTVAEKRWYSDKIEYIDYSKIKELKKRKDIIFLSINNWFNYSGVEIICFTTSEKGFWFDKDGWAYIYIQNDYDLSLNFKEWSSEFKEDKTKEVKDIQITEGLSTIAKSTLERTTLLLDLLFNTTDNFNEGEYHYKNPKKDNFIFNTKENADIIKSKTLLIEENSLYRTSKEKKLLDIKYIKSIYKGDVKIVTEEELKEAIKNNDKGTLYFHIKEEVSMPVYSIVDIATRKIIYAGKEKTKPGDSNPGKIFERMLLNLSNSIYIE